MTEHLYIIVNDGSKDTTSYRIRRDRISNAELIDFDRFLAYYNQNYRLDETITEYTINYDCQDIKEVRGRIIDLNSKQWVK